MSKSFQVEYMIIGTKSIEADSLEKARELARLYVDPLDMDWLDTNGYRMLWETDENGNPLVENPDTIDGMFNDI